MKLKYCPKCHHDDVSRVLTKGRKNIFECNNLDCRWRSKAFTPKTRPIKYTKKISANNFPGYCYNIFDVYGQPVVFSRSYTTEEEAIENLKKEIEKGRNKEGGPYTGVLWPDVVEVKGKKF